MTQSDTKQRILDAAEVLFAAKDFGETSLRALTQAADVNLAAVHYHFGSKERLFAEVVARIVEPINQERLRCFDALETSGSAIVLEDVLRAFLEPAMVFTSRENERAVNLRQLISRMQSQRAKMHAELMEIFSEVMVRFTDLLARAVPALDEPTLFWRVHFLIGSMCFTFDDSESINQLSRGMCSGDDTPVLTEQMVTAFAGAFRAPVPSVAATSSREHTSPSEPSA